MTLFYMCTIECNQKCSKCSHWKYRDQSSRIDPLLVVRAARETPGCQELVVVGGEPLLFKPEISAIIKGLRETNIRVVIITNALALDGEFLQTVKNDNIHFVVSIDTIDRELWKFVRGVDSYDLVLRNVKNAVNILTPWKLSVQSVRARETEAALSGVAEFAKRLGVTHGVQDYIVGEFGGSWTPCEGDMIVSENDRCYAAYSNLCVMQNGDVFGCFQQNKIPGCQLPLGNITKNSITEILSSEYYKKVMCLMENCCRDCKVLRCNIKK